MATTSPNLNMTLPDANDNVNIAVLSNDLTIIDTSYGTVNSSISTLNTNVTTLSSTVTGLNTTVTGLNTTVSGHTSSISTLNTTVSGHTTSISTLNSGKADKTHTHTQAQVTGLADALADKSNLIAIKTLTCDSITITSGGVVGAQADTTYSGYTALGIVAVNIDGTDVNNYLHLSDFTFITSNSKRYAKAKIYNSGSASKTCTVSMRVLYVKDS